MPQSLENQYLSILIKNVPASCEDMVTEAAFSYGASGVVEELQFTQTSDKYTPEIVESDFHDLNVFFEKVPSEEFYLKIEALVPASTIEKKVEENKDWLEEWKKGFEPFLLAEPFWVVPSWKKNQWLEKSQQKAIYIDPGMAFGTGTHATTQLAAELVVKNFEACSPGSVLDVGTGTGILAMLAKSSGAEKVVATEIDEMAREVARENCRDNQLSEIEVPDHQVEEIERHFDLVIANIIDGILLSIKDALLERMKEKGSLILTGILTERAEDFKKEFLKSTNLQIIKEVRKDEWIGLLLKNKEALIS